MSQDNSGSAFPIKVPAVSMDGEPTGGTTIHPGLTKRELFAAMAMQGMWANRHFTFHTSKTAQLTVGRNEKLRAEIHSMIAEDAVLVADALLAELAKEKGT